MSTISGVGQGLYQFLRSVGGGQSTPAPGGTNLAGATSQVDADGDHDGSTSAAQQGAERPHHHHGGGGGRFKAIASAVTEALQAAKSSGDGSADVNKIVQDAIAKVLGSGPSGAKQNAGGPPPPPPGAAGGAPPNTGSAARSAFLQTLQQYGIDPQQFRDDFKAALQSVRGQPADASASVPPGALVDTTA